MEILASEAEDGILRYSDDGMSMYDGGWWKASIWNPRIGGSSIDLACRPVGGRWEVTVAPNDPDWPSFVIAWPSDTFDAALHASIAILRT